jgi:hypothetical protein
MDLVSASCAQAERKAIEMSRERWLEGREGQRILRLERGDVVNQTGRN